MILDQHITDKLKRYVQDIKNLPNESAKRHCFSGLISSLFPDSPELANFFSGVEKTVHIDTSTGLKHGRVDSYYGNSIIEFEKSLKATERHAKYQLQEYCVGIWKKEGQQRRPLLCIASDGIFWKTYVPHIIDSAKEKLTPDDVKLELLREIEVKEENFEDFYIWLTGLLFREGQLNPTAELFQFDFGAKSAAFWYAIKALNQAWNNVGNHPEPTLAFNTWKRYLTVTYGRLGNKDEANQEHIQEITNLFLKHTYLASIAALLIWAALSKGKTTKSLSDEAKEILSGQFFHSHNIENIVENDFFQWVRTPEVEKFLSPIWEKILSQMLTYDLSRLNQDVLKGIYQELVDPKDRHDLGEYYTPEWLCEKVVESFLPNSGFVKVLDPSCGSGSFLRASISHLLSHNTNAKKDILLQSILNSVYGIDIHPLAVIIAKSTYLLAIRNLLKEAKRPLQIPVYLADALFLPKEVIQRELWEVLGYEIFFGKDKRVSMPEDFVKSAELFDPAINLAATIAIDHAKSRKESIKSLRSSLTRSVNKIFDLPNAEDVINSLWNFTEQLAELIQNKENSIWAFIVRNSYRPAMLKDQFDFIVGNPPWLSYRYISDLEYQAEVKKRAIDDYGIAPKSQKLFTQMELATIFFVHALATFGKANSRLAFVMPRSILTADQHERLRNRTYKAEVTLDEIWDLDEVKPVFNVPSCVMFATKKACSSPGTTYSIPALEWSGKLPYRDISWSQAEKLLTKQSLTARLIFLGKRNALSTKESSSSSIIKKSDYAKHFHQGATIVPRSFYFVTIESLEGAVDREKLYWAETDKVQAKDAKPPYDDVFLQGHIEGQFIFTTALSKHIFPFAHLEPALVVLPIEEKEGHLTMYNSDNLREDGYRSIAKWMEQAETLWASKRKSKADKQTIYQWLDYNKKLTNQNLKSKFLVLYNSSGTNISACFINREALKSKFVVESTLYWCEVGSEEEAYYLCSILNAQCINLLIKPFQAKGIQGERHIHKKVLELPMPFFDSNNKIHLRLAELGKEAGQIAILETEKATFPKSLALKRSVIREAIKSQLSEIDDLVISLLKT